MKFVYNLDDSSGLENLKSTLSLAQDPSGNEAILIEEEKDQGVMIAANKEGWLKLAKACIEMACMSDKDPSFHVHRNKNFEWFNDEIDAIGLFILSDEEEEKIIGDRRIKKR